MSDVATRAQIEILAKILHTQPTELGFLERLPLEQVAQLVSAVSDDAFDQLAGTFRRVSKLAPLVPNSLVASVSQKMIPPLVAGRAAGALGVDHPDRITAVLSRIKPEYMAACAPYLDPRTVRQIAPRISADLILPAARLLLEHHEYAVAARFIEHATPQLITDFEKGLDDDAGILRTAALVVDTERLGGIIRSLPQARVERILHSALADDDLTATALSLLARLDTELQKRYGRLLFDDADQRASRGSPASPSSEAPWQNSVSSSPFCRQTPSMRSWPACPRKPSCSCGPICPPTPADTRPTDRTR